jgi:poly [ADP-ribose] polymerase 7/11/12/13
MERDSNRPVVERNLFHGTCRNVVDSICRNNFDWRLCGAHGTMYGQGMFYASANDRVSHIFCI